MVAMHINKSRTIPEIFDIVASKESKEEKVKLLRAYNTKGLQYIINGIYNVNWDGMAIPSFEYSNRPPEVCAININNAIGKLESAYKYRHSNSKVAEKNLITILEEVSNPEADLIINMINGKKIPGISKSVFKEAYPNFFL